MNDAIIIDTISPREAQQYAAEQRIRSQEWDMYAQTHLQRCYDAQKRAAQCRAAAAAFEAAARGEWEAV